MFEDILEYMKKSRLERRSHIDLSSACIFIGGHDSRDFRGLLAHYLKTTIPVGRKNVLCHACNNHLCSNVLHLYWGSGKDNAQDQIENGTHFSILAKTKTWSKAERKRNSKNGRLGGKARWNKPSVAQR